MPANPGITSCTLQRRRSPHQHRQPLAVRLGHVAQRLANDSSETQVVVRSQQRLDPSHLLRPRTWPYRHPPQQHHLSRPTSSWLIPTFYQIPLPVFSPSSRKKSTDQAVAFRSTE